MLACRPDAMIDECGGFLTSTRTAAYAAVESSGFVKMVRVANAATKSRSQHPVSAFLGSDARNLYSVRFPKRPNL